MLIPFTNFFLAYNYITQLAVPEYIMGVIRANSRYYLLYLAAGAALLFLCVSWVLVLPLFVLERKSLIDTLMKIKGKISGIFVGAAGLDSGNNTSKIKKMLKEKYPKVKIQCENDIYNVIACGKNLDRCVAAISGTGMIIYANQNGNLKHFGGRGYLLDKGGSGYHIGRDAICAAQDARDGIGEHTILTDLVEEKLGNTVWESIQDIYSKNQSYIASFTPCVFLAYENGDKIAEQILKNNAACLAELINFAVDHYDIGKYVVASGGILKQKPAFREMLKEMLHPDIELDVPDYPPVYGACIMCCLLCGVDTKPVKERFMMSYDSYQ